MARVLFFGLNDEPQNIVVEVGGCIKILFDL